MIFEDSNESINIELRSNATVANKHTGAILSVAFLSNFNTENNKYSHRKVPMMPVSPKSRM